MNLEKFVSWNDPNIRLYLNLRTSENPSDEIKDKIANSKSGYISIKKIAGSDGYLSKSDEFEGVTALFGKGLRLYISNPTNYFSTSIIQKINEDTFETLNSIYSYKFEEIDPKEIEKELDEYAKNNGITYIEYEGKS
jgi:hypothetical protein